MSNRQAALFAGFAALGFCGCGTICNFAGKAVDPSIETRVYGGVQLDLEVLDHLVSTPDIKLASDPKAAVFFYPLAIVDPLFCLVADTLTLPITLHVQEKREQKRKRASNPPPALVLDNVVLDKPVLSKPAAATLMIETPPNEAHP